MKKLLIIMICCGFVFMSCAGSPRHIGYLTAKGTIRVEPVDDDSYDYKVSIINLTDFSWDGKNEADRIKAVNVIFKDQCKNVEIIDETPIQTGKYAFGNPAITYILKVKCEE